MSTSSSTSAEQQHDQPETTHRQSDAHKAIYDEAEDTYTESILENGNVCSRCFRRVRELYLVAVPAEHAEQHGDHLSVAEEPTAGTGHAVLEESRQAQDADVVCPPRVEAAAADLLVECDDLDPEVLRATPPQARVCKCGAVDNDSGRATMLKREAMKLAWRASKRLSEQDVAHDREMLLETVWNRKRQPDLAGRDDEILGHAIRYAVEMARLGRSTAREPVQDGKCLVADGEQADNGGDRE